MNEKPHHENAYQLARWVAERLPQHNGASPRELYQHYLPQFAAFGADGTSGTAMITQHLRKLEERGFVISEKTGKERTSPRKWYWVGGSPEPSAPSASVPDPATVALEASATTHSDPDPIEPSATDRELLTVAPDLAGDDGPAPELPEQTTLELGDPWDELARQFAQACREQTAARPRIADVGVKLGALRSLQAILSDDLCVLLDEICADLTRAGA